MTGRPSFPLLMLGGLVGTLLMSAFLHLVPVLGFPFLDYPHLLGGVFTASPTTAFWLGHALFFLGGVLFLLPILALAWLALPGDRVQFRGAFVKGVLWGLILWLVSGLLLPVPGWLNQLTGQGLNNPGFFALELGPLGAVELLVGNVLYATALALVAAMARGFSPFDTLGWMWTSHASG
jgi:hypothetical protein